MSKPFQNDRAPATRGLLYGLVGYLAFVVYGSLVPLDFQPHGIAEAWQQFLHIRYYNLDEVSRADWVANIVLYLPLSFLAAAWVSGTVAGRLAGRALYPFIFGLGVALAIGVEFTQQFFPPRTVSLNDLLAETIGTTLGIVLWDRSRGWVPRLAQALHGGGRGAIQAALVIYALGYLALSLFPYDFVVSLAELSGKLSTDRCGWVAAGGSAQPLVWAFKVLAETLAVAPIGTLLSIAFVERGGANYGRLLGLGLVLGAFIEGTQLFLVSGVSQGLSVATRGVGVCLGVWIHEFLRGGGLRQLMIYMRRVVVVTVIPYVALVALMNGWDTRQWTGLGEALSRLPDLHWMPFYYHYYTSEPVAVFSFLAQFGMYLPIGIGVWGWHRAEGGVGGRTWAVSAALYAALMALVIEVGKLFIPARHPDPTDVLIGAFAAWVACTMPAWIERVLMARPSRDPPRLREMVVPPPTPVVLEWPAPHPAGLLIGGPAAIAALLGLVSYPIAAPLLAIVLLTYGLLLWRWPLLWVFVLPALLPALDLSSFTGRLLLDEVDLFVLVTLVVAYVRVWRVPPLPWANALLRVGLVLLWGSWAAAIARGLWPSLGTLGDIPVSSHSPMEVWIVGKGMLWALLLVPILRRVPREALAMTQRSVLNGVVTGLAIVTLVVLWERHVYVGLLDFERVFRVTGSFSSMQTGGAYIEAFIAFAFPALAVWILAQHNWMSWVLGVPAVALTTYAMLVTFSRGGYAGLAAGLSVVALGSIRQANTSLVRRWMAPAGIAVAVIVVAVPILSGGFAKYRLARAGDDLAVREAHWRRALDLMDDGLVPTVLGMGFGQYPLRYLLKVGADDRRTPGTYSVTDDGDNPYLRLGAGEPAFLDQRVRVAPESQYLLSARVRQPYGGKPLRVAICEKALLYSFECVWYDMEPQTVTPEWSTVSTPLATGDLGTGGHWPHRPVKLSLYNPGNSVIDVDGVSLTDRDGRELVKNGEFSDGVKHWLFVTDQDLAWHIHQQWVDTYFAQGLLGLLALVVVLIGTARVLFPAVLAGNQPATAFAGALVAFLTVGLLGSTTDTARLAMLFYFGMFAGSVLTGHGGGRRGSQPGIS